MEDEETATLFLLKGTVTYSLSSLTSSWEDHRGKATSLDPLRK